MAAPKIRKYNIINHGPDAPDYFPGYGISLTPFTNVAVGVGNGAKEAYEDALDQLATMIDCDCTLPLNPRGIRKSDRLSEDEVEAEFNWYVVIQVQVY